MTAPDLSELSAFLQRHGIGVVALLVLAVVAFRLVRPIVHRSLIRILKRRGRSGAEPDLGAEEAAKRAATIEDLVSTMLRLTVILVTVLVLLTWFDLLPVIAGLGVLARGDHPRRPEHRPGLPDGLPDRGRGAVQQGRLDPVGGRQGEVEEIGLRRTTLRDTSGTVHSVSNGEIRISSNLTRIFARMQVDMTVAFGTDLDAVTRIVNEVGAEMAADPDWKDRLLEMPTLTRVPAIGDLGITVRVAGKVQADRPLDGAERAAQAADRGVPGERHRDPGRGPRSRSAHRPVRAAANRRVLAARRPARRADRGLVAAARPARVEWPPVVSSWRWARERRAVVAAGDREPPGRGPDVPAVGRVHRPRRTRAADLYAEAEADFEAFWAKPPASGSAGSPRSTRPSNGTCRSRSGSSAASSTSPTTASTGMSSAASATRSPTTGSASPATPGRSPTATSSPR